MPSMFYERSEAAACAAHNHIYVFGGAKSTGNSIERFNIEKGYWELLSATLPRPISRACVHAVNENTILILGGAGSHWVYKFSILELYQSGLNPLTGQGHSFIIEDCENTLSEITETVHPCIPSQKLNCLVILNSARRGFSSIAPGVVKYSLEA